MKKYHLFKNKRPRKLSYRSCSDEKGIALVMTLLLGTLLFSAVSALMVRQLASRRHVASESYRQMAILAANNGLNQILSTLNNDKPGKYSGYLLGLSNIQDTDDPQNNFRWERINSEDSPIIPELCTETSQSFPIHPQGGEKKWPTDPIKEQSNPYNSIRTRSDNENKELHSFYRLRSYKNPPKSNQLDNGEATFIIEGLVRYSDMKDGDYLSRAHLERSLKVEAAILKKREDDWAILFAENYKLGKTTLDGKGLITWQVPLYNAKEVLLDCGTDRLLSRISSNITSLEHTRIWPVTNQTLQSDVMNNLFYIDGTIDAISKEKGAWSIDDTTLGKETLNHSNLLSDDSIIEPPDSDDIQTIIFKQNDFCPNSTTECHIYIEKINLSRTKLYIENSAERLIVLHLNNPSEPDGLFQLSGDAQICGVDVDSTTCNAKPEWLIIMSDQNPENSPKETSCGISSFDLKLEENNIPHAFIFLQDASLVLTSATKVNGAIWARNICANDHQLDITVPSQFMESVYDIWGWKNLEFAGLGRSISRTIRGSGYDIFKRF